MRSTPIDFKTRTDRIGQCKASTVVRQLKRFRGETALNEPGRICKFCRREREVTPFRLALSIIESFAKDSILCIADIRRTLSILCGTTVQYKPFHNQLSKREFPTFMRLLACRLLNELACDVLRFSPRSPFARFEHVRILNDTSVALKPTLSEVFLGQFATMNRDRESVRLKLGPHHANATAREPTCE